MEIVGGSLNLELSALCNLTEPYDFGGARRDRTADLNTASVRLEIERNTSSIEPN